MHTTLNRRRALAVVAAAPAADLTFASAEDHDMLGALSFSVGVSVMDILTRAVTSPRSKGTILSMSGPAL